MKVKFDWSLTRAKHAKESLIGRGVSEDEFEKGVLKGMKIKQQKDVYEAIFSYFKVVFEERIINKKMRKIYPITVFPIGER